MNEVADTALGQERGIWGVRARRLVEQALYEMDDNDVIGTLEAAIACLRIEMRELPESELDGYPFPDEEPDESRCICPPELLERGGHRGGCPVHT